MGTVRRTERRGFTLLEVILAMALSVLLLGVLTMAVDLYWKAMDRGRMAVENAQLARALLARIATDLRAAMPVASVTQESATAASTTETGAGADGGVAADTSETGTGLGSGAAGATTEQSGSELDTTASISAATTPVGASPGIYGNQFELQLDVQRALRSDEFQLASLGVAGAAAPIGVTTLSYYVYEPAIASSVPLDGSQPRGLVRREMNRAVALFSGTADDTQSLAQRMEILAPEVVGLEFRYFDGTQWLLDWDSDVLQASPRAIEILLTLQSPQAARQSMLRLAAPATEQPVEQYRLVVDLPVSKAQSTATDPTMGLGTSTSSTATATTP